MKICYLADITSIHTKRWVDVFLKAGHEVHVISRTKGSIDGVTAYCIPDFFGNFYFSFPFQVLRFRKLIKKINPDVLHSHFASSYGILGGLSGKHPHVVALAGSDIFVDSKRMFGIVKSEIKCNLKKADTITAESESIKTEVVSWGIDESKVHVFPWGVDLDEFKAKRTSEEVKKELGITNEKVILSIRGTRPIYNNKIIVKAFKMLKEKKSDVKLLILGKGHEEEEVNELVVSLGLKEDVVFLGFVQHPDMPDYISISDVTVSIPTSDSLSIALLEAMACGSVPIISNVGANLEFVDDSKNGFIVKSINEVELFEKLLNVLENESLESMKILNKEEIAKKADWKMNSKQMLDIFSSF